jgi:hypothetical protein
MNFGPQYIVESGMELDHHFLTVNANFLITPGIQFNPQDRSLVGLFTFCQFPAFSSQYGDRCLRGGLERHQGLSAEQPQSPPVLVVLVPLGSFDFVFPVGFEPLVGTAVDITGACYDMLLLGDVNGIDFILVSPELSMPMSNTRSTDVL